MASNSLASLKETAQDKLDRYTSKDLRYAFNTYDNQGEIDLPLTPADVLMANLLSLRLTAHNVIPLFVEGEGPAQYLRASLDKALVELQEAEPFESYDSLSDLEQVLQSLSTAETAAKSVKWWTAVTVSKVLHRRRPHIVPLIDSRVYAFYDTENPQQVRRAMWKDIRENEDWLKELAATKETPDGRPLTLLRLADILIWTPEPTE